MMLAALERMASRKTEAIVIAVTLRLPTAAVTPAMVSQFLPRIAPEHAGEFRAVLTAALEQGQEVLGLPEGLEKQLSKQDLADVIEYLMTIR